MPPTTIMRDSNVGDAWIQQAVQMNPVQPITDATTGAVTGDFLTGPVRLAFCDIFKPGRPGEEGQDGKYGTHLLFPPGADFGPLSGAYYELAGREFAENFDAGTQQYHGIHSPFRSQSEKLKFGGYTPDLTFLAVGSHYKPPVVDHKMNPIVDESRVYPGVWAIASINAYVFGKSPPRPKKGISFGLQSLMIIADDDSFGGGAPDPKTQFGGVAVTPPVGQPGAAFGQSAGGGLPGQPPVGVPVGGGLPGQPPAANSPPPPAFDPAYDAAAQATVAGGRAHTCGTVNAFGSSMCDGCFEPLNDLDDEIPF